jgi:hypothetical protein
MRKIIIMTIYTKWTILPLMTWKKLMEWTIFYNGKILWEFL